MQPWVHAPRLAGVNPSLAWVLVFPIGSQGCVLVSCILVRPACCRPESGAEVGAGRRHTAGPAGHCLIGPGLKFSLVGCQGRMGVWKASEVPYGPDAVGLSDKQAKGPHFSGCGSPRHTPRARLALRLAPMTPVLSFLWEERLLSWVPHLTTPLRPCWALELGTGLPGHSLLPDFLTQQQ